MRSAISRAVSRLPTLVDVVHHRDPDGPCTTVVFVCGIRVAHRLLTVDPGAGELDTSEAAIDLATSGAHPAATAAFREFLTRTLTADF